MYSFDATENLNSAEQLFQVDSRFWSEEQILSMRIVSMWAMISSRGLMGSQALLSNISLAFLLVVPEW